MIAHSCGAMLSRFEDDTFGMILVLANATNTYAWARVGLLAMRTCCCLGGLVAISMLSGCGSGASDGSEMPSVNPSAAAGQAIEQLDKDGSGSLDESELAASPALLAAKSRYDSDGNGQISQNELEARLSKIYAGATPWMSVGCRFMQGGRPLAGAKVRFIPEPFLSDALQPASGTTDAQGLVHPAVADDSLPEDKKGLHVMRPGVYRIEVEHASVKKPHEPLGCEVDDFLARGGTQPVFQL
jgi:hypothetical protein